MVVAALVAVAAVAFAATYAITKSYARREDALARRWYQLGERNLSTGNPGEAVSDYRTALLYARDNPYYRRRLADALAADNDIPQAISYFLGLWDEQPGSGPINLELARLYARDRQIRQASQHFNNAIYGVWPDDPVARRRKARIEYIKFLMDQNQMAQAQAEAIALTTSIPPGETAAQFQAADLLIKTGDPRRALDEYTSLLKANPAQASLGAGKAAFQLGWFHTAAVHLKTALAEGADDPEAKNMLAQAQTVLDLDPSQRHISSAEAAKRVSTAYVQAASRLQFCAAQKHEQLETVPPSTSLQLLYNEWKKYDSQFRKLSRDPDLRDTVMDLVLRVENETSQQCGTPTGGPDWALLMISKYGDGVQR
ncbi:MAG TPA: tetratricopeptide repeat protein [Terriglobales bacterium]|nr:tetratricopeptide repeat protein [Terriglobales bacterium]